MAKWLITGGAGFIGSSIAVELVKRGEKVRVLDNFCEGKKENLKEVIQNIELIEGDIRDKDTLSSVMKDVDYVLHQAALRSVPRSVDDPVSTNEVNITGTLNVLMAAKEAKVKRVVFASSSSIYGDLEKFPQSEDDLPSPISPYAASKVAAEYYCKIFSKVYELETVSLRYFNVFGPKQDPASEYAAVVPRFILSALKDEELEIHGDGLQSRDFTYIDNVVSANILSAITPDISGEVFNIACGKSYAVIDIKNTIEKILGKKLKYYHTPERKGDVQRTWANIGKAEEKLKLKTLVDFDEGIKKTIKHFKTS